eukprot:sb/3472559/
MSDSEDDDRVAKLNFKKDRIHFGGLDEGKKKDTRDDLPPGEEGSDTSEEEGDEMKTGEEEEGAQKLVEFSVSDETDPDLVTSSGERVLVTKSGWALNRERVLVTKSVWPLNRGQIHVNFLYRGKFILSLNRGVTQSGVNKSGSDCILNRGLLGHLLLESCRNTH